MRTLQNIIPKKTADGWEFEVLGVPFGGHLEGKDAQGEYFTKNTDIMMDIGDERPVIYYHGDLPSGKPNPNPTAIGKAKLIRTDEQGHWFSVKIKKLQRFAERLWQAAVQGIARASGGSLPHLVRKNDNTGELYVWPLSELTLLDQGQGRRAANQLATVSLKAVYEDAEIELPESFIEKPESLEVDEVEEVKADLEPENKQTLAAAIATVLHASKRSK